MTEEGATLSIGDYAGMLIRHWWLALLIVAGAVAGAIAWTSTQDDVFEGTAVVLLRTGSNSQLFPPVGNNFNAFVRQPTSELEFVQSDAFRGQIDGGPSVSVSAPEADNRE
ncbi:MAG: hypothetical protein ACI8TP_003197 [Acidimicrobiales bacterium]|jgi:uncharacterized protein involved in exopolysaccharide biosynthesis